MQGRGNQWLRGSVYVYAAQASAQIDTEIVKKDHLWMETSLMAKGFQPESPGFSFIDFKKFL